MSKIKILGVVTATILAVIAIEFALIYIWNVHASILYSLKYILPAVLAIGILVASLSSGKSMGPKKKEHDDEKN